MKKILTLFMMTLSVVVLAACVTVANKAPVLTGVGFDAEGFKEVSIDVGDEFDPLEGVTSIDDRDGDITEDIVVSGWEDDTSVASTHTIRLVSTDSDGLKSELTILLTIESIYRAPVITGVVSSQTHYIGTDDWDPLAGVKAYENDDYEVEITDQIIVRDTEGIHYDLTKPGTYTIRLRVTNTDGVQANMTITLTVKESEIPVELPKGPVSVEMWHAMGSDIENWIKAAALDFRAEYLALGHDFTVNIADGTGNYDTLKANMSNAIIERKLPNLVQGYPDHVAEYLNGGAIQDLNPYIEHSTYGLNGDDDINDIIESYRLENQQYRAGGIYYSLPFNKSTEVLIYNKSALAHAGITDEADVPTTWQGWFAIADDLIEYGLTKNPEHPTLVRAGSYDSVSNGFITLTRQFGGKYTAIDPVTFRGQYLFANDAQTFAAMQFMKDNRDVFVTPQHWDQDYSTTPFAEQKLAFAVSSSAGIRHNHNAITALEKDKQFDYGVTTVPYNAEMPENRAVIQQGTNISVVNTGTNEQKLVSWLFIKYLLRTENTVDFAIETGYFPVRTSGFEDPRYVTFLSQTLELSNVKTGNALSAKAADAQRDYFFYDPAFVGSSKARTEVGIAFEAIMTGNGNIQEALNKAYSETTFGS